ncbi:mucin-5AC-like [Erpetoichthys calabaricus]|uniref:mucin-5AC-like n=1 Tax=Erpetoichthys calabaricus TaxID=27687 RepID=UPI00223449B1|nr:mucin-5AC-like [Erpetoichthys calabaricus]
MCTLLAAALWISSFWVLHLSPEAASIHLAMPPAAPLAASFFDLEAPSNVILTKDEAPGMADATTASSDVSVTTHQDGDVVNPSAPVTASGENNSSGTQDNSSLSTTLGPTNSPVAAQGSQPFQDQSSASTTQTAGTSATNQTTVGSSDQSSARSTDESTTASSQDGTAQNTTPRP